MIRRAPCRFPNPFRQNTPPLHTSSPSSPPDTTPPVFRKTARRHRRPPDDRARLSARRRRRAASMRWSSPPTTQRIAATVVKASAASRDDARRPSDGHRSHRRSGREICPARSSLNVQGDEPLHRAGDDRAGHRPAHRRSVARDVDGVRADLGSSRLRESECREGRPAIGRGTRLYFSRAPIPHSGRVGSARGPASRRLAHSSTSGSTAIAARSC